MKQLILTIKATPGSDCQLECMKGVLQMYGSCFMYHYSRTNKKNKIEYEIEEVEDRKVKK